MFRLFVDAGEVGHELIADVRELKVRDELQNLLTSDNVFGDDGGALQLAQVTGDTSSGYHVALTAPVDTATTQALAAPQVGNATRRRIGWNPAHRSATSLTGR